MLEVVFHRDERDRPSGFSARGHAEFDVHGKDVVCAAVSGILQAARLGISEYARVEIRTRQQPGRLEVEIPAEARDLESVRAIVATARLAIEQIAAEYPDHLRFAAKKGRAGRNADAPSG